jgi:phthiocerol/phenolphthiocerol synthesis type-I polyketide synthase B
MMDAFGRISGMTDQQRAALSGEFDRASRIVAAEPIAVVGIGCRFPGDVAGPEGYWRLLVDAEDAISEVPADRWDADAFYDPDPLTPGRMTTKWGGFVSDIARFDADFFGITPREAGAMDPQQRMLLEVAWEALEHAGISPDSLSGSRTGVMMGVYYNEYQSLSAQSAETVSAYTGTGNAHSVTVGRIAYLLGLRGPAVAVDTACSSSLVAVHLACQSLRLRESDLALAGGVNVILRPETQIAISAWGLLSKDGRCKTFDASADGFVRGEGCGVVVLKRLVDAVRDGDRVLAVVRGSAINQDGRSNGVTAPNAIAQRDVIAAALRAGDVTADSVDYIETHGTGTVLGDPIEFEALAETYGHGPQPCALGSSKTNLGHLEAAAGIAGFIKATLAIQHGQIPPNLHFSQWNPGIDPSSTRFFVPTENTPWSGDSGPRRAAVSSFGFGGTNAHVVLEQGPTGHQAPATAPAPGVNTLVISGKTSERVASWAGVLADWMADAGEGVPLADIAHSVNHHRARRPVFATVCASDPAQAVSGLRAVAVGQHAPGVVLPHDGPCGAGTVFVYSGQGSQWAGMGRQLLADEPAFAAAVDELEPDFVAETGFSLRDVLAGGEPVSGSLRVQSVLVGMQLALTALWRSYGVEPDAVIGHSMGEVSAAVVAGALSAAEGLRVIATRARLMSRFEGHGAVALIHLDTEATEDLIAGHPDVTVTVYASPRQTVAAGPVNAIDDILALAAQQNTFARRVNMEVPSHHAMMDPILPELRAGLAGLTPRVPRIPVIPTALENANPATLFDADYWVANVRNAVRFRQAIAAAGAEHTTFVEISPHPVLTKAVTETLAERHHHSLGTLQRDDHDTIAFHTNLNATHTIHPPRTEHPPEPHTPLPSTPWGGTHHWIDTTNVVTALPVTAPPRTQDPEVTGDVPADWLYEPCWHSRPSPTAATTGDDRWVVFADQDLGAEFGRMLGSRATVLPPDGQIENIGAGADYVLYAPRVSGAQIDEAEAYELFNEARRLVAELVDARTPDASTRLVIVTRNAQPVSEGERANPVHGVLWGLGRTLALEHPEIWGGIIDLDEAVPAVLAARCVLAEAHADDGEDQVVYRAGVRYAPRLERRSPTLEGGTVLGPDGSHLVVGATGNIGPQLIGQLADMGAKTIVAVSRRPGNRLDELSERLAATGTTLIPVAADAADASAMAALFDRFGTELPPLDGIYLAAFAGGPVTLRDMTDDDVHAMFRPKLDAVRLLHELSLRTAVSQFVLFSSISGILGSRWLGHYAATSTFLDTLAFARRALGLPATVVNWGVWKSLADNQTNARQVTSDTGMEPMDDDVAIRALALAMRPGAPVRSTVVDADWPRLAAAYRTRGSLRIVDDLLCAVDDGTTVTPVETEFRKALRECAPERRHHLLLDHVTALASAVMGLPESEVLDPSSGFFQLGMDSLMSVTLGRNLSETLGESFTPAVVFDYPTVEALTDHLVTLLPEFAGTADSVTDAYDDVTEDELLQQLSERLA